jgi:acyl-CoA thioester hydrolase
VPEPPLLDAWVEHVRPEWIDYNGHLSEAYYVLVFGHATDAVMAQLGMTPQYLTDTATSLYTLEAHVRYLDEVPPDSRLEVRSSVIGVSPKLLLLWHELWCEGRVRASEEVLAVHVDTAAGRSSPLPPELRSRAEALRVAPPEHASRRISLG